MASVKRRLVNQLNVGDIVRIPYIDFIYNKEILFKIDSLPNKFINTARMTAINSEELKYKDELVDHLKVITKVDTSKLNK